MAMDPRVHTGIGGNDLGNLALFYVVVGLSGIKVVEPVLIYLGIRVSMVIAAFRRIGIGMNFRICVVEKVILRAVQGDPSWEA